MKELILVRGLPNSGKSTVAKIMASPHNFQADDYFYDEDGNYEFVGKDIKKAHADCQRRVREAMEADAPKIAVANTFTREWEFEAYHELAEKHGYRVHHIIVEGGRHDGDNGHGVPDTTVQKMEERFQIKL